MHYEPRISIDFGKHSDHFQPGEVLVGQYGIERLPLDQLAAVEVSVLWRTEGKGDEDLGVHFFKRFSAADEDYLGADYPMRFNTRLPGSPLSYDGLLVKIHWCVRVRVFEASGRETVGQRAFYLGDVQAPRPASTPDGPASLAY